MAATITDILAGFVVGQWLRVLIHFTRLSIQCPGDYGQTQTPSVLVMGHCGQAKVYQIVSIMEVGINSAVVCRNKRMDAVCFLRREAHACASLKPYLGKQCRLSLVRLHISLSLSPPCKSMAITLHFHYSEMLKSDC